MIKILLGMAIMLFAIMAAASTMSGSLQYNPTHDRQAFIIDIKIIPREQINEICQNISKGKFEGEQINGCAAWAVDKNICRIYVPEPLHNEVRQGVLSIWGHELMHCAKGSFHE